MAKNQRFLSAIHKLHEIGMLDENWNGYGAHPFDFDVIMNAFYILQMLKHPPFISPTANQSIQMEYEKSNGDYFEIEVFKERIEIYEHSGTIESCGSFRPVTFDMSTVASLANNFTARR